MPIDPRMVAWDTPKDQTKIDPRMVRWTPVESEKTDPYAAVANEQPGIQNFLAGTGGAMKGLALGLGQRVGLVDQATVDEHKRAMEGLKTTTGGQLGSVFGEVVPAAGATILTGPGYLGAIGTGAALGASTPTSKDESAIVNTLFGAGGGLAGQFVGGKIADAVARSGQKAAELAAKNVVRDSTLAEAQSAGYAIPPSMAGSGIGSRILEGVSGKYKTNQLAGIKNQAVTDSLARKAVGLADDAPITSEAMRQVRANAYQTGYAPVEQLGMVKTDADYLVALDKLVSGRKMASNSFPNAVKDEIAPAIDALKVGKFDAGEALKMSQILRDEASAAYRAGDNAMGQAKKGAAKAIEDQIERALSTQGGNGAELLKGFRDSRALMAKSHTVEDAIREGGGMVDAKSIGRKFQGGSPLSGELKTIGQFANNFRDVAGIPQSGHANPFTVLDMFSGGLGAGAMNPAVAALPLARVAARYGILNPAYQARFVSPQYGMPALESITPALQRALPLSGGLLGVELAQQ